MNIDVYILCGNHRQLDLVCERISEFSDFPKISGLCQKHAQPLKLLEKLGEVFKNIFLTAMYDLKRHIKAGTATQFLNGVYETIY